MPFSAAVAGFVGYVLYRRFDLPAVPRMNASITTALGAHGMAVAKC